MCESEVKAKVESHTEILDRHEKLLEVIQAHISELQDTSEKIESRQDTYILKLTEIGAENRESRRMMDSQLTRMEESFRNSLTLFLANISNQMNDIKFDVEKVDKNVESIKLKDAARRASENTQKTIQERRRKRIYGASMLGAAIAGAIVSFQNFADAIWRHIPFTH